MMIHQSSILDQLESALKTTTNGVLGLVDELLTVATEHALRLDWKTGKCAVELLNSSPPVRSEIELPKPVIRAVLARVAALCNERHPNSVSPYGGSGEFFFGAKPTIMMRAKFVNMPEEQSLELSPLQFDGNNGTASATANAIAGLFPDSG